MKRWHLYFVTWRTERVDGAGRFGCILHDCKGPICNVAGIIKMVSFIRRSNKLTTNPIITGITLLKKTWFRKDLTVGMEWSDE